MGAWMQPKQSESLSDAIAFVEDDSEEVKLVAEGPGLARWKILVVDDDEEVHAVTRFVLGRAELLGRPLELIEARSLRDAQDKLLQHPDIAVILLDVVMEEHDSGLKFARWVREAGLRDLRIILRTGQAGYAPELDVIRDYDINDYRAKSELTHTRLITSITAAIRAFEQIDTTERSWRGLERIVTSCSQLFRRRDLVGFSDGVLLQIASLAGFRGDGMICAIAAGEAEGDARIVSGIGALSAYAGRRLRDLPDGNALKVALLGMGACETLSVSGPLVVSMDAPARKYIAALDHNEPLDPMDAALLRVFAANIAVGFENVGVIERLTSKPG
jgi:CheY-like chemotaxis protein